MDQAVLVHAHVHEGTEGGDVGHRSLQDHARFEILDLVDAFLELGGLELRARVAAWLIQLGEDVGDGGHAELIVGEIGRRELGQHGGVADQLLGAQPRGLGDALDHRIGLRVHRGAVQRVGPALDTQEAGGLLERLRPQARHFAQLLAGGEPAVFVAVGHDVLRHRARQAGNSLEQRRRRRVHIHADGVHRVLHHRVQCLRKRGLVHVVLVLAHADGLRVDLDQLRQRILQSAGNGYGGAQGDVHVRELLRRDLAGGVHRRTGLGHHHRGRPLPARLGDQVRHLSRELFRLARGRAVAHCDELHAVLRGQRRQLRARGVPAVLRLVRVHNRGGQDLAGLVHHGALHAVAVARIQRQRGALAGGRGEQHVAQVGLEHFQRALLRLLLQPHAGVQVRGDLQLGAPAPAHRFCQPLGVLHRQVEALGDHAFVHGLLARVHVDCEHALGLAAQQRQDPVAGQFFKRLGELEVVRELHPLGFLALHHGGAHGALAIHAVADLAD